jgi:hypothetical protein
MHHKVALFGRLLKILNRYSKLDVNKWWCAKNVMVENNCNIIHLFLSQKIKNLKNTYNLMAQDFRKTKFFKN